MREVAHTHTWHRAHIASSRHANIVSNANEAKLKILRMCFEAQVEANSRPVNIERTLNFPSRCHRIGNPMCDVFALFVASAQTRHSTHSYVQRQLLQFYFSFSFRTHVTSKYRWRCLFVGLYSPPSWMWMRARYRRNEKWENVETEYARCRSQPMKIRWILRRVANMAVPSVVFTTNSRWNECKFYYFQVWYVQPEGGPAGGSVCVCK